MTLHEVDTEMDNMNKCLNFVCAVFCLSMSIPGIYELKTSMNKVLSECIVFFAVCPGSKFAHATYSGRLY